MRYQKQPRYFTREKADGTVSHYIDLGKIKGKKVRKKYDTKKEAEDAIKELAQQRREKGNASFIVDNPRLKLDIEECLELLKPSGISIKTAVRFYLTHSTTGTGHFHVKHAIELWEASKLKRGNRPNSVKKTVASFYKPFLGHFGNCFLNTITKDQVQKYLDSKEWSPLTYNNHVNNLKTFYRHFINEGKITLNPLDKIHRKKLEEQDAKLLTPKQVKSALQFTKKNEKYSLMSYLCLVAFCGIRPEEATKLTWGDINLEKKLVTVSAQISKKSRKRFNEIADNALLWLQLAKSELAKKPDSEDEIRESEMKLKLVAGEVDLKSALQRMWKSLEIEYPTNALRHSFASYHVAQHKNHHATQLMMGHYDGNLLHHKYRELVNESAAKTYWGIIPKMDD